MDPFQKRDKIPRTPPGQSFVDRSYIFDGTTNGECSIYDESGNRRTSVFDTARKYTLTFDNYGNTSLRTSCDIVTLDISLSLKPNRISRNGDLQTSSHMVSSKQYGLFTSSPVNVSTPRLIKYPQKECNKQTVANCTSPDKGNIAPSKAVCSEIVTVKKRHAKRKCDISSDSSVVNSSVQSTFVVPSTVRQLRPRRKATPIVSDQSLSHQSESLVMTKSVLKNPNVRSTKRKKTDSSHLLEVMNSPGVIADPVTPPTLVPRHRRVQPANTQRRRRANVSTSSTSLDYSKISSNSTENDSIIHQPSTIRKKPRVQIVYNSEDEPIAARLRRRNTRVSYTGTKTPM
ncbi:unnamed protein product [Schistosoma rodhaini]|uniref:Uncharacterized protein n=1 Tax=Schistosoma mansoni TaxID=6183 RepID=A0A3Q0KTM1_SCHMA|nr:unnamed protein product [Schistosoma rodhaini]